MTPAQVRTAILGLVLLAMLVGLMWVALAGGDEADSGGDPALARIEKLARRGDADALAAAARNERVALARHAVRGLGRLGPRAAPRIERVLREAPRAAVREEAARALVGAAGDARAPALAEAATEDRSPDVRSAALTGLASVRAVDEMEAVFEALLDENRMVRRRAATAVEAITGRRWELYVDGPPHKRAEAVRKLRRAWPDMRAAPKLYWDRYKQRRGGP